MDTPTNGSVTTSLICLNCPITFGGVDFGLDLVCLPLKHIDVIFERNRLLSFGVNIN